MRRSYASVAKDDSVGTRGIPTTFGHGYSTVFESGDGEKVDAITGDARSDANAITMPINIQPTSMLARATAHRRNSLSVSCSPPTSMTANHHPFYNNAHGSSSHSMMIMHTQSSFFYSNNNNNQQKPATSPSLSTNQNHCLNVNIKGNSYDKRVVLYKTEMCRTLEETGHCKYGVKCQFAHDRSELRQVARHPRYKTEVCKTYWQLGRCPYGKRCCFIHSEAEVNPGCYNGDQMGLMEYHRSPVTQSIVPRVLVKGNDASYESSSNTSVIQDDDFEYMLGHLPPDMVSQL